jgi:16S rRNA (uracil1498-N3)-methyltransferase
VTHVFRFFLPDEKPAEPGTERALSAADARRTERVLRLRDGEPVEVADAGGRVFAARMRDGGRVLVERLVAEPPPPAGLAVRLALTGPRADTAVEKLVELGVERIGPLETELKRRDARVDRWQRIAAAAAAQAKRPRVPAIEPAVALPEALGPGAMMLSHEQPDGSFDDALARAGRPLVLLVGPESGFSDAEHAAARAAGVPLATLGASVLRTETAAIAAAVLALDRLGYLRPTMPA